MLGMREKYNIELGHKGKRLITSIAIFSCILALLFGCGKVEVDKNNSPTLTDVIIKSWNAGSMEAQYVDVSLLFDKPVCWKEKKADSLRVTISDQKVNAKKMDLIQEDNEKELTLRLTVTAVTNGTLHISRSDSTKALEAVTSADGKYAANDFEIDAIIPSGVELSDVSEKEENDNGNPQVMKQVTHAWNIRSIAWIQLLENGEPVTVGEDKNIEILDQAVAVHGHEFLKEDEYSVAQSIAETLEKYYSDDYKFTSTDDMVSVEKCNGDKEIQLDLKVYTYLNL